MVVGGGWDGVSHSLATRQRSHVMRNSDSGSPKSRMRIVATAHLDLHHVPAAVPDRGVQGHARGAHGPPVHGNAAVHGGGGGGAAAGAATVLGVFGEVSRCEAVSHEIRVRPKKKLFASMVPFFQRRPFSSNTPTARTRRRRAGGRSFSGRTLLARGCGLACGESDYW